jgi:thioredoxin-like negative regulator of GroEL
VHAGATAVEDPDGGAGYSVSDLGRKTATREAQRLAADLAGDLMGRLMQSGNERRSRVLPRLIIVAAGLWLGLGARAADVIHWYSSVEEASAEAVPANRPIMIDFWAEWCGPCKVMEKEVYATDDFRQATKRFLPVKIDYDKKTAVARRYNIEALPTIVFADSYGNELFRYHGYLGAKSLLAIVNALPGDVTEFNRLNKVLAADKNNFQALESMGRSLRDVGLFRASSEYYAKAAQRTDARSNPEKRETILDQMGLNYLQVEDGKLAAESFERCLKEFPNSPRKTEWTLNLGQAYAFGEKKDKEKAKKILEALIRESPSSPASQKASKILSSL